jgi:hypothetical protein
MVVATSTAVATSSSSAVPTATNAAPRYFFNSVFFAASVYGLINSIILSKKRIKFNFVIHQTCCSRGFEVGKTHSAAPLLRHGGLGVDLNPSRFGSTPAITPIDLISSTVLLSISLLFVHSKIEN